MEIKPIARIKSDFKTKFGIPRQPGLAPALEAAIVFEEEYRTPDALRGLGDFSHLWIIWEFSENIRADFSPTVRPPRLGGDVRLGVFATRSPFRPNPVALSCVRLLEVKQTENDGTVLIVSGADLMDGTPIYDIKPYIPYADCKIDATGGFTTNADDFLLTVDFAPELLQKVPKNRREALIAVLSHDPRPSYQADSERVYGMEFAGFDIRFTVNEKTLTVREVTALCK